MSKQSVGLGSTPNDGNGDGARVAFDKINDNFDEIYTAIGDGTDLDISDLATLTDLASTSNGDGASMIGIEDSGGLITATTVEGALAEIQGAVDTVEAALPSGDVVGTTDTQTLTNKTLTTPIVSHNVRTDADNYTLVAGDANGIVIMSGGSANALTIPTNAAVAFAIGTKVEVWSTGAGTTTIAGDTGVTLQGNGGSASAGSCDIQTQYGGATLTKIATNTWMVGGDIDVVS